MVYTALYRKFRPQTSSETHIVYSVGTEELAHLEMVGTLVRQLTDGCSAEELEKAGLGAYYTDHGVGLESIQKEIK